MATKPKKKKAARPEDTAGKDHKPVDEKERIDDNRDERFDFGGLPQRDIKKNLGGCG